MKLVLLAAHDVSIFALANVLEAAAARHRDVCGHGGTPLPPPLFGTHEWPPHCSAVAFELHASGVVRVSYQWREVYVRPAASLLAELRMLALEEKERARLCELDGAPQFRFGD